VKRAALYSNSPERVAARTERTRSPVPAANPKRRTWREVLRLHRKRVLYGAGALSAVLLATAYLLIFPGQRPLGQNDIDAAVQRALESVPKPFSGAEAYEAIKSSVVRVRGFRDAEEEKEDLEHSLGTGVVILDTGVILTNLHVVSGAKRVTVVFADGLESEATVTGARPEHDLAVLQAATLPDDLVPATLRPTMGLAAGDPVVAVGFPFGIGPSVSAGVISGLAREFRSLKGERVLTNLIQFDAAVNPGNSGGPLVTANGEVVGIVTGILNPTEQRFFVGIGFAVPIENAALAVGIPPF
jgi:S1-C subfamily serine protease